MQAKRSRTKRNLGSSLRSKKPCRNPMREYDQLPPELRNWLSTAILPWRPRSVQRAFDKALARSGNPDLALAELDRVEAKLIAKDAPNIWGDHVAVSPVH
ncbi:MAG: DUF6525 family protein [Pseudomonadota bacterium]